MGHIPTNITNIMDTVHGHYPPCIHIIATILLVHANIPQLPKFLCVLIDIMLSTVLHSHYYNIAMQYTLFIAMLTGNWIHTITSNCHS